MARTRSRKLPQACRRIVSICRCIRCGVVDLLDAGGEVAVPEQRQLLAERDAGRSASGRPTTPAAGSISPKFIEPAVDRLEGLRDRPLPRPSASSNRPSTVASSPSATARSTSPRRGAEARPPEQVRGLAAVERVGRAGNQRSEQVRWTWSSDLPGSHDRPRILIHIFPVYGAASSPKL